MSADLKDSTNIEIITDIHVRMLIYADYRELIRS